MDRRTIDLRIAGQNYRVMSSASEEELRRLAELVNTKVAEVAPKGRTQASGQAVLLAAMALAHELESERGRREDLEQRTKELLRGALVRINDALRSGDDGLRGGNDDTLRSRDGDDSVPRASV